MAWIYLLIAGLLEIVWAYFMKQSDGFTRLWPSVATLAFMARQLRPAVTGHEVPADGHGLCGLDRHRRGRGLHRRRRPAAGAASALVAGRWRPC